MLENRTASQELIGILFDRYDGFVHLIIFILKHLFMVVDRHVKQALLLNLAALNSLGKLQGDCLAHGDLSNKRQVYN